MTEFINLNGCDFDGDHVPRDVAVMSKTKKELSLIQDQMVLHTIMHSNNVKHNKEGGFLVNVKVPK